MEIINTLFGHGKDLTVLQMGCRTGIVFFAVLLMIRIAGRRSFGKTTALDNIVVILLGAILSRAVVGASPFIPTIISGFILVLLHRVLAMLSIYSKTIGHLVKGESRVLFENGNIQKDNLHKMQMSEKDLRESVRAKANTESLDKISRIIMERDGQISVIKE
jgi:uncharacterized membrane protein YcaP (DUF421 family)